MASVSRAAPPADDGFEHLFEIEGDKPHAFDKITWPPSRAESWILLESICIIRPHARSTSPLGLTSQGISSTRLNDAASNTRSPFQECDGVAVASLTEAVAARPLRCDTHAVQSIHLLQPGGEQHKSAFKWRRFEPAVILLCVRWCGGYQLSYRGPEGMMRERGLSVRPLGLVRCCAVIRRRLSLVTTDNAQRPHAASASAPLTEGNFPRS
jgi:hypothetical protein